MRTGAFRIPQIVLAWVAMLWVGFTATPLPHHCEMAEPSLPSAHHDGGHHGTQQSGPAGSACHCVGHACGAAVVVPAAVGGLLAPRLIHRLAEPPLLQDRLAEAATHLLPFSLAPPAHSRV